MIAPIGQWRVQVGKGSGKYTDRYTFPSAQQGRAILYFNSLNTHSGYKKRLINPLGEVVARVIT